MIPSLSRPMSAGSREQMHGASCRMCAAVASIGTRVAWILDVVQRALRRTASGMNRIQGRQAGSVPSLL